MSNIEQAVDDANFLRDAGMDGVKWATEFKRVAERLGHHSMDEGWLIGWFCNAIMAGYDDAERRNCATAPDELTYAAADVLAWFDLCRPDLAGPRIHRLRYALAAHSSGNANPLSAIEAPVSASIEALEAEVVRLRDAVIRLNQDLDERRDSLAAMTANAEALANELLIHEEYRWMSSWANGPFKSSPALAAHAKLMGRK